MNAEEEIRAWQTWQERCALDLVSDTQRDGLCSVIRDRFISRVRRIKGLPQFKNRMPTVPDNRTCGHLFETYCAIHQRKDGKAYKQWLLTRGSRDLNTIQSGVMLLIRNVVREWVRDCHPRSAPVSLQQELGSDLTLEQCLPSPDCTNGLDTEVQEWLKEQEADWISALSDVERTVLWVRASGRVFSDSRVQQETGVGKTTLHKYHRALMKRWAGELKFRFPDLSPETGAAVVMDLMDRTGNTFLQKVTEKPGSGAFRRVEDT